MLVLLLAGVSAFAAEYRSPSFIVKDPVVVPGAGFATSSGFQLWSVIGEPAIGLSDAASFILKGGFLYFPAPSTATTTPPVVLPPGGSSGRDLLRTITIEYRDFNDDGVWDIIDLSILLFHYGRSGAAIARYDLNGNGTVDFPDISILFYYWGSYA